MVLVSLLRKMDLVLDVELNHILSQCQQSGEPLLAALVAADLVDEEMVAQLLAAQLNLNRVDLDRRQIDPRALTMIPGAIAFRFRAMAVGMRRAAEGDVLYVAMTNPSDAAAMNTVTRLTGMTVLPLVATETALGRCLTRHYTPDELTDQAPFGILPPDEGFGSSSEVPVVVGHLVSEEQEVSLRNVRDAMLKERGPPASGSVPASVDEFLTASTQEVLEVYAPLQKGTARSEATDDDLLWLEGKRDGESMAAQDMAAQDTLLTSGPAAERSATRVDYIGPTTLVCPDIGLRTWVKEKLTGLVSSLRDHADLATAVMEEAPVANMVLIHPSMEPHLVSALKVMRSREIPPRVYVLSANKAFDVLGGVDVRIDPPDDEQAVPRMVYEALAPKRR